MADLRGCVCVHMCVCVHVCVCACACACARVFARAHARLHVLNSMLAQLLACKLVWCESFNQKCAVLDGGVIAGCMRGAHKCVQACLHPSERPVHFISMCTGERVRCWLAGWFPFWEVKRKGKKKKDR